jgi:hypothetical protein
MKVGSAESVGSVTSMMTGMTLRDKSPEKPRGQLQIENDRLREILHERVTEVRQLNQQCELYKHDAKRWEFAKQKYCVRLGYQTPSEFQKNLDQVMEKHSDIISKIDMLEKKSKQS